MDEACGFWILLERFELMLL